MVDALTQTERALLEYLRRDAREGGEVSHFDPGWFVGALQVDADEVEAASRRLASLGLVEVMEAPRVRDEIPADAHGHPAEPKGTGVGADGRPVIHFRGGVHAGVAMLETLLILTTLLPPAEVVGASLAWRWEMRQGQHEEEPDGAEYDYRRRDQKEPVAATLPRGGVRITALVFQHVLFHASPVRSSRIPGNVPALPADHTGNEGRGLTFADAVGGQRGGQ